MDLPRLTEDQRRRVAAIATSYLNLTGSHLVPGENNDDFACVLWTAPFAIVAHGTESDPIFFFGNRTALKLFELDFIAFTRLPSRLSAEPLLREERAYLLERVERDGIINDYAGIRISSSGRRFRISNAAVWNLSDSDGRALGQAAAFGTWDYLSVPR